MSTEPSGPPTGGELIPLRAAEAQTEVRLDEGRPTAASYVDLTSGETQRKPCIRRPRFWPTRPRVRAARSGAATRAELRARRSDPRRASMKGRQLRGGYRVVTRVSCSPVGGPR